MMGYIHKLRECGAFQGKFAVDKMFIHVIARGGRLMLDARKQILISSLRR